MAGGHFAVAAAIRSNTKNDLSGSAPRTYPQTDYSEISPTSPTRTRAKVRASARLRARVRTGPTFGRAPRPRAGGKLQRVADFTIVSLAKDRRLMRVVFEFEQIVGRI